MEAHEELLEWSETIGVELNGIRPLRLSGRGFGIVATKKIPSNEVILQVPLTALRALDTVPRTVTQKLPKVPKDMTVHGLLAADLVLDKTTKYRQWNAVVPTWDDLQSMPITWPSELQAHLPTAAKKMLKKQEAKFRKDFGIVSGAFPEVTYAGYMYAWLLVNTRTFYYTTPKTEKLPRDGTYSARVLLPFTVSGASSHMCSWVIRLWEEGTILVEQPTTSPTGLLGASVLW